MIMGLQLIRIRNLEMRTIAEKSEKRGKRKRRSKFTTEMCIFPSLIAFIFIFSLSQLIFIHRTIESYKIRTKFGLDCGSSSTNHEINESLVLADLAIAHHFIPSWPNSTEWRSIQHYPYKLATNPMKDLFDRAWLGFCPLRSPFLKGPIPFNTTISIEEVIKQNPHLEIGGKYAPQDCNPLFRVAIVIPYRDRTDHLISLLNILHPMLQKQMIAYRIFVSEQYGNFTFNKGLLMNAGFLLAMNSQGFDCVIFHDVDLIPENDRNLYNCDPQAPKHLSVSISSLDYRLPYASLVGGVLSLRIEDFIRVNGYSNLFWGWGGEDDDLSLRMTETHLRIARPDAGIARYRMLDHKGRPLNKFIHPLLRTSRLRYQKDGLTNCHFRLIGVEELPLYTNFLIDPGRPALAFEAAMTELTSSLADGKYYNAQTLNQAIPTD